MDLVEMRRAVLALHPRAADYTDEEIAEVYSRSIRRDVHSPELTRARLWAERVHGRSMRQIQRARAAQLGLCIECNALLEHWEDRTRCNGCALRQRHRQRQKRTERTTAGLCGCGRKPTERYRTCEMCRARSRENYRKRLSPAAQRQLDWKRGPLSPTYTPTNNS